MNLRCFLLCSAALCLLCGCIELQAMLRGGFPDSVGGDGSSRDGDWLPDNGAPTAVPEVTLTVSNMSPVVNEEVLLTCSASSGSEPGITYTFEPDELLLDLDPVRGTAVFIPSAADVGTEFPFSCRGTSALGTGEPSATRIIIPLGSE